MIVHRAKLNMLIHAPQVWCDRKNDSPGQAVGSMGAVMKTAIKRIVMWLYNHGLLSLDATGFLFAVLGLRAA